MIDKIHNKDYYKILGVSRNATMVEIKKAYRRQAKKFHPDTNPNNESLEEKFKEIIEAFEYIGNEEKRQKYDALIDSNRSKGSISVDGESSRPKSSQGSSIKKSSDTQEGLIVSFKREFFHLHPARWFKLFLAVIVSLILIVILISDFNLNGGIKTAEKYPMPTEKDITMLKAESTKLLSSTESKIVSTKILQISKLDSYSLPENTLGTLKQMVNESEGKVKNLVVVEGVRDNKEKVYVLWKQDKAGKWTP